MTVALLHDQAREFSPRVARVIVEKALAFGWIKPEQRETVELNDLSADFLAGWIVHAGGNRRVIFFKAETPGRLIEFAGRPSDQYRWQYLAPAVREAMRRA